MYNTYAEKYRIVDQFDTTYWSGQDCSAYLNDIFLDEFVQLNYQIIERVQPYFHYSSYLVSKFHHGARLVTGELTINYKQSGYWFSLMQKIRFGDQVNNPVEQLTNPVNFRSTSSGLNSNNLSGESLKSFVKSYNLQQSSLEKEVNSVYNETPPLIQNNAGIFEVNNSMNLLILWGGHLDNSQTLRYSSDNSYVSRGTVIQDKSAGKPTTGFKLLDVQFGGTQMQIDDSGRPIMETISFQARNIVPISGEEVKGFKK